MQKDNLPAGFISVQDAIKLIESDSRKDAKVDTEFLLRNLPYLRVDGNYTIKKLKHKGGKVVSDGETFVQIRSEYDRAILEHAITEHYRNVTGVTVDPEQIGLASLTTTVDEDKNPSGLIANNPDPGVKFGDDLVSGTRTVRE